jgi:hypothetical protein
MGLFGGENENNYEGYIKDNIYQFTIVKAILIFMHYS